MEGGSIIHKRFGEDAMKRLLTSAAAAAVMVAGTGSDAQAQGANAHLFDLALGIGGAYHYNWLHELDGATYPGLDDIGDRLNPGFAPIFTGAATFWTTPTFGIRTNLAYSDIDLPDGSAPESVNGWFYDLNLMFRPWIERDDMSMMMSSMYFFLGGGGVTANPPGSGLACVSPYLSPPAQAACLPVDGDKATVGQGTAGLGFDLMSLSNNIGLFTELGLYGYDSPFHTGPVWTGQPDNEVDSFAWTGRLTAGLKFGFGELIPVVVPPPVTPPPPPPVAPAPPSEEAIRVCVVQGTMLTNVDAIYIPARGDTVVMVSGERRPFATVYPSVAPDYAAGETWYINNDSITVMDTEYVRFGVPRVITSGQLTRVGDHEGVGVYAETGADMPYSVIYVPLRPGCEFQPYQVREEIRVRG
jgi:hypothetical protein